MGPGKAAMTQLALTSTLKAAQDHCMSLIGLGVRAAKLRQTFLEAASVVTTNVTRPEKRAG